MRTAMQHFTANRRADVKRRAAGDVTHLVTPGDYADASARHQRSVRARCGELVPIDHGLRQEPTCAECLRMQRHDEEELDDLLEHRYRFDLKRQSCRLDSP